MIVRNHEIVIPNGDTRLEVGDLLVLAARSFEDRAKLALREVLVERGKQYANRPLSQSFFAKKSNRVILIKRGIQNDYSGWKHSNPTGGYSGTDSVHQ